MKKIAFLDRDGVINKKAPDHCYIEQITEFIPNEGIFEVLKILKKDGFEFIIITNQRGIARGLFTEETLHEIHEHMIELFAEHGIDILDILYCPHENDICDCRKPKPGMLSDACKKYEIDIKKSLLISDSKEDILMGQNFGLANSYFVTSDKPEEFLQEYRHV